MMQEASTENNYPGRILPFLALVFTLCTLIPLSSPKVWAEEIDTSQITMENIQPQRILLALADPPDFLTLPPTDKEPEKEEEGTITPFLGIDQSLTLLPTPERPAIAASDVVARERPEVTAGVHVDLGTFKLNLGYTLPSGQVDSLVRPLGVNLEPGADTKRFSLGVKIPF